MMGMSTQRTRQREPGAKVKAGAGSLPNMAPELRDESEAGVGRRK